MIYGYSNTLGKIKPTKDIDAYCEICTSPLIAKMGQFRIHHWAHKSTSDCPAIKPEGEWHRWWKSMLPKKNVECVVNKNGQIKIADILLSHGKVVELQNSPISIDEIKLRESHYDDMFWIFNCTKAFDLGRFFFQKHKGYWSFEWKHGQKILSFADKKVFLDLGQDVFLMNSVSIDGPCKGNGFMKDRNKFVDYLNRYC